MYTNDEIKTLKVSIQANELCYRIDGIEWKPLSAEVLTILARHTMFSMLAKSNSLTYALDGSDTVLIDAVERMENPQPTSVLRLELEKHYNALSDKATRLRLFLDQNTPQPTIHIAESHASVEAGGN